MANHTYQVTEIVGTSTVSVTEAIRNGVAAADQTMPSIDWFEVTSIRGFVAESEVQHFQVQMKIGGRMSIGPEIS